MAKSTTADDEPPGPQPAAGERVRITPDDLDSLGEKLKLLEFGLYGLQESARLTPLDPDDLGPFVRLAEEIGSDVEALRARLTTPQAPRS